MTKRTTTPMRSYRIAPFINQCPKCGTRVPSFWYYQHQANCRLLMLNKSPSNDEWTLMVPVLAFVIGGALMVIIRNLVF